MSLDLTLRVHLNAVIQLIHEHTNSPIVEKLPKIYTSCPVEIVRKTSGRFAFVNAAQPQFEVRVELPLYLPETLAMDAAFSGSVRMVRMSPKPDSVLGNPSADQTDLCGSSTPHEKVYLHCGMKFCTISLLQILPDGRALFESSNFLDAGTGRTLLLTDGAGGHELVTTMIESKYPPNRYFLSEQPLRTVKISKGIAVEPVITVRADEKGRFLAAATELRDGTCQMLGADGGVLREYPFRPGGRFILKEE